jgi:hypothetical protein
MFCVRADMMSAALVREINTDFLPARQGALRLRASVPEAVEPIDPEVLGVLSGPHRTVFWAAGPVGAPNPPTSGLSLDNSGMEGRSCGACTTS